MPKLRAFAVSLLLVLWSTATSATSSAEPAKTVTAAQAAAVNVDFNGDGVDDLAASAEGEDVGDNYLAGAVHVLYGSSSGLRSTGRQVWTQDSPGVAGVAEDNDRFGMSLAAGDFDGDGFSDLAVGVPWEGIGSSFGAGVVHVLYGSPTGLQATGSQLWSQNSVGVSGSAEIGEKFGGVLVVGQFGRGVESDLAIGVPSEAVGSGPAAGVVHVLYGSTTGLTAVGSQLWSQSSAGVIGAAEVGDGFGSSLAAADVGRSSPQDLVIGVSSEGLGQIVDAGAVQVLYASASGLTSADNQLWTRASPGVAGRAEPWDEFGSSLVAADFGKGGYADLAIGSRMEHVPNCCRGAVHVLYGSAVGLSSAGSQIWTHKTPMLPGTGDNGFGWALTAGDFGRSTHADLAIGLPLAAVGGVEGAGGVKVLYGSTSGLGATGSQYITQSTPGVVGTPEAEDRFGTALAAGDFDDSGRDDLAVGAPQESVGPGTGVVHVIRGSTSGLNSANSQLWTNAPTGTPSVANYEDYFGSSIAAG